MILAFAIQNKRAAAAFMLTAMYLNLVLPLYGLEKSHVSLKHWSPAPAYSNNSGRFVKTGMSSLGNNLKPSFTQHSAPAIVQGVRQNNSTTALSSPAIGGPSQPEMTRFKPVDANNLVNLFTGDFSYNIPLLDVGGYPVNLFYDGGNTPEEEASWVGLGWNINPGTISRSMRGVPDDFNGTEKLITTQTMKPNITWGGRLGADVELVGVKNNLPFDLSLGGTLGISFNNYLGPALEQGIKGGVAFKLASLGASEKSPSLGFGAGINANLSSRGGLTISPNVSFSAKQNYQQNKTISGSIGLSTRYNSRTGIQTLNINTSASYSETRMYLKKGNYGSNLYAWLSGLRSRTASRSASVFSSTISFAKPSYSPAVRLPITNESYAGRFQIGTGIYGGYASAEVEVYKQTAEVNPKDQTQYKPIVGYLYFEKAKGNSNAVLDFSRVNDKEVTPNTPIISAPQYAYDIFSINGEGTGGAIRLYRNDDGYVRDNLTTSKDKSFNAGVDIGIPGHYGTNINWVKIPTTIGDWNVGNKLKNTLTFKNANEQNENVYFRNPGETSVLQNNQFEHIEGDKLVRFKLGGSKMNPTVEPTLEVFNGETIKTSERTYTNNMTQPRKKRTQVVSFLTANEASEIGLDKQLKSYNAQSPFTAGKTLNIEYFNRIDEHRLPHHISQVNVTEGDGTRYIYGIPVYNKLQKDFTFTVPDASPDAEIVNINPQHMSTGSEFLAKSSPKDGYLQVNETPAYAHSFLLSGLLSPDYVDVQGDGITEDDQGTAVKFNYTRIKNSDGSWAYHNWRTPHTGADNTATFNAGNRTNSKDDKGMISYGERESWYLHSVESKTMIALFTLEPRTDGIGAQDATGEKSTENALRRLKKIDLYNKADLKKNGLGAAKPVKTVHFEYSYKLCAGDIGNPSANKLTLDGIYFTFNGKNRNNKNQYKFSYENTVNNITTGNPSYSTNSTDRWGSYKPKALNPAGLPNADYPYSYQPVTTEEKNILHQNAGAWNLKKILLPSGGQIEVEYESDDYAFVQNRRASTMMQVEGFSNSVSGFSDKLYDYNAFGITENTYVLIKVPEVCVNDAEVKLKYIQGQEQLAFKLAVYMPKGIEYITSYAYLDANQCGVYGNAPNNRIWVKLKTVSGLSPLSLTALEFLKEQLPGQAFPGYDVSEGTSLQKAGELLVAMMMNLKDAFRDPINTIRSRGDARKTDLSKCFVRLNDPDGRKYGGGYRVKKVLLKDNWQAMTQQFTSVYGTEYNYETTETFNGVLRTISSGVASYEPSIGGDENPFQTMLQVADKLPLGPTSYNAIEMPVLDAFFPAPVVGYSKVTVKSIRKGELPQGSTRSRSGIGTQVTEFYTAKDFPVLYMHTGFDNESDLTANNRSLGSFWFKWINERRTLSQGFLVATNDMHGKMKSQASYAENDPNTRISFTENFYRNTGVKGFDEKFDFVHKSLGGKIEQGNMGIDIELMTDVREFKVESIGQELQAQVDFFPIIPPAVWLPFIWPVSTRSQNIYRAVTCTKVISYHSIIDKVVVTDKGSTVTTENLVFDAETGAVVVNKRNNEFGKPVYTTTYPAWWAYSGMGLAYKNIDAVYTNLNFNDGKIINRTAEQLRQMFESGDEMYITSPGTDVAGSCAPIINPKLLWAYNKNKNSGSLTDPAPDFVFMDEKGKLFTKNGVSVRIVRSGHRNMLDATVEGITSLISPVVDINGSNFLKVDGNKKTINATAVEYREKWQTDNDVFRKYRLMINSSTCQNEEITDCTAEWEKSINPYRKGLLGTFRPHRSMVYYDKRTEENATSPTDLPNNGQLTTNFKLYWDFNSQNNLVPDLTNTKWVWNSQITRLNAKGMELETKDALNIYTAAQYGYNKTLPLAITNNSRYNEMFYAGFEDHNYDDLLNQSTYNICAINHMNFPASIVSLSDKSAHTGKNVLQIPVNTTDAVFSVKNTEAGNEFQLNTTSKSRTSLLNPGGNFNIVSQSSGIITSAPSFSNLGMTGGQYMTVPQGVGPRHFRYETIQYFEVISPSTYDITSIYQVNSDFQQIFGTTYGWSISDIETGSEVTPINIGTNVFSNQGAFNSTKIDRVCLPPGKYKLTCEYGGSQFNYVCPNNSTCQQGISYQYRVTFNQSLISYKDTLSNINCTYTVPVPASETMMNPTFSIPTNKKMVFSAWVKESVFNANGYANNLVQMLFDGTGTNSFTINPSGPVIEGWQRYEGSFTAPNDATQMTLRFVNNSGQPIYFDDIRIHPYNSNMKSYVYDPVNLRLLAELDANNYASYYEYDEEGQLIRTKAETKEGIKTIRETRSAKQKTVTQIQQ
jgi:hypothetical protein